MGLASGQARLLSITARLTDNEYRSQRLTNARLNLSSLSEDARVEYQEALSNDKFVYVAFNSSGKREKTDLTPTVLWQYQPSKNQYALRNTAGNVLVDSLDAKNFEETDNLAEFLKRYDCLDNVSETKSYVEQVKIPYEAPNEAHKAWEEECAAIDAQKEKDREAVENWVDTGKPVWDDEAEREKYTVHVYDWQIDESAEAESFYDLFRRASKPCYDGATLNWGISYGCYLHVLAHMLDLDVRSDGIIPTYLRTYDTSAQGKQIIFSSGDPSSYDQIYNSAICIADMTPMMKPISDIIANGYTPRNGGQTQIIYTAEHSANDASSEPDKLLSDYYLQKHKVDPSFELTDEMILSSNYKFDSNGNIVNKTLKQKCIDLFYLVDNHIKPWNEENQQYYQDILIPFIKSFQEDMQLILEGLKIVDKGEDILNTEEYERAREEYEEALANYTPNPPVFDENDPKYAYPEEPPKTVQKERTEEVTKSVINETLTIIDPEKAQWYTNLWYRMNGMDNPERIYKDVVDIVNERSEDATRTDYLLKLFDIEKQTYQNYYEVLPSNLATSKDWLNNALAQGWVTMQKVGVSRTADNDEYKWSDIVYTNATDIIAEEDSEAIASAEAKYSQIISDIDAKDKRYQMQIRSLDTEHNALQTEYNSVKSAVDKNIDRSYKIFQG